MTKKQEHIKNVKNKIKEARVNWENEENKKQKISFKTGIHNIKREQKMNK